MAQAVVHTRTTVVASSRNPNTHDALLMPLAEPGKGERVPTIGVRGEEIEDGARDPDTIAEEQRRRSDERIAGIIEPAEPEEHASSSTHASKK